MEASEQLVLGFIMSSAASLLSLKFQFLTLGGALSASVVGTVVFGVGGFTYAVPLLVFFLTSSLFSSITRTHLGDSAFEKTGARDSRQVLANGGVATSLVLLRFWIREDLLFPAYLGSIAAVTADTWGTELGVIAKRQTRSIVSFRVVPPTTSGGVSAAGTAAGIGGALVIAISGWLSAGIPEWRPYGAVVVAGVVGSVVDSVLGASVQRKYQCARCGRLVERSVHCETPGVFSGGYLWMTNDSVNLMCAVVGASVASVLTELPAFGK